MDTFIIHNQNSMTVFKIIHIHNQYSMTVLKIQMDFQVNQQQPWDSFATMLDITL